MDNNSSNTQTQEKYNNDLEHTNLLSEEQINKIPLKKTNKVFPLETDAFLEHAIQDDERPNKQAKSINPFPLDAFPELMQEIVRDTNQSLNFPVDFTAASMLFAVSVAIGNSYAAKIKENYTQNAILYLAIVAKPGMNKTHPLKFAIKPLDDLDEEAFLNYKKDRQEFDNISSGTKQKEGLNFDENDSNKPKLKQILISDFTQEALVKVHSNNKKGIGVYSDELAGWINNFNRYNRGSEEQFWLSVWSGSPIRVNRISREPDFLKSPFISVAGTIQPGVLERIVSSKSENGFIDRILFVKQNNMKKKPLNENQLNPGTLTNWKNIIDKLFLFEYNDKGLEEDRKNELEFTPDFDSFISLFL